MLDVSSTSSVSPSHAVKSPGFITDQGDVATKVPLAGDAVVMEKPLGVRKIEAVSSVYGIKGRVMIYFFIFLIAYAYGLDGQLRFTFQTTATSSYAQHSLLSTVNVIRAVVAAAAQPVYARLSDVFGRQYLLFAGVIFYTVGTIIESQAYDVQRFAGGAILYQFGYTGVILMLEILVADFSFLNWRLVCSFVPALPFIINTWISGNIVADLDNGLKWSWGIGMWAIIFPIVSIPLCLTLIHMSWKAKKTGVMDQFAHEESDYRRLGLRKFLVSLFWQLDIVGVLLLVAVFALILVPFTLAGGVETEWQKAKIIAPLVIGFCMIPVFIIWEWKCPFPVVPFHLLRQRTVWSAMIIAILINFIWYMQGDFMYTVLMVAVDQSAKSATRITSLYSFVSVITGTILGLIVVRLRKLKLFVVFGTTMWLVSMGMMIHYRGGESSYSGIIGSLCLMGFGAGLFTYPVQTLVQACTKHEHMAVVTALYLSAYNIGSALGSSVSGAIWTQILPGQLVQRLGAELGASAYASPFTFILTYTWGTEERELMVEAYRHTQKILIIVGTCLCVALIGCALLVKDIYLESVQSLEDAEKKSEIPSDSDA